MANIQNRPPWNENERDITPEDAFVNRRSFIGAAVKGGVSVAVGTAAAYWLLRGRTMAEAPDALKETLKPPDGSAFTACDRVAGYEVERPMTDELVAARYNNFYEFGTDKERCWREAQNLSVRPWTIEVGGLVEKPKTFDIDELIRLMPCEERVYRFRCVERWAMVVPWSGFVFSALMKAVQPLSSAKYVRFVSFNRPKEAVGQRPGSPWNWPYYEGLTINEAANELTFVATGIYGHDIPRQHGAPFRMVVPWKYGYKGSKSVVKIEFVDQQPKTFWNDYAPNEYGFYSNVNPQKPHPRWSQEWETMIGTNKRHRTVVYNGYGDFVGALYSGNEH